VLGVNNSYWLKLRRRVSLGTCRSLPLFAALWVGFLLKTSAIVYRAGQMHYQGRAITKVGEDVKFSVLNCVVGFSCGITPRVKISICILFLPKKVNMEDTLKILLDLQ